MVCRPEIVYWISLGNGQIDHFMGTLYRTNVKAVGWFQNLMYAVLPVVFKCEKWPVYRRECRNLRLIGNKMLRRIFGLNRHEVFLYEILE